MVNLGIEIGGTKLQVGVGNDDGKLLALERRTVDSRRGAEGILAQLETVGRSLVRQFDVSRIGIGFGGPVDPVAGRVTISHQVAGWEDFPLTEWCRDTFGVEAVLGNDCDAAALAEARHGAGRGHRRVFYVTVGTGVGGGFVLDGEIYGRDRPAASEIGHLRPGLDATDPQRTVESIASGRGLEQHARQRIAGQPASEDAAELLVICGGDVEALTARQLSEAAQSGNQLALAVFAEGVRALGWAVAQMVTLLAPEVVVLGGGVSLCGKDLFFEPLRRTVTEFVFPPLAHSYQIVPAALGEDVVVHGALALAGPSLAEPAP